MKPDICAASSVKYAVGLRDFLNVSKSLSFIDRAAMVEAGVVVVGQDDREWTAFRQNPMRWLCVQDDDVQRRFWGLVSVVGEGEV